MTPDWQPISTAPRDGTKVELMHEDIGEVWPMQWEILPVRLGGGIWAMWGFSGSLITTWPEEGGDGPTHWRPWGATAREFSERLAAR